MLHKYIHYAWQFTLLTTVIMVLVHRNADHNQEQWRHRAPAARPKVKKFRKQRGQGGGFTGNFRATPAPLQATSFVFPFQFTSVLVLGHTFSFQATLVFLGPHRLYIIKVSNDLLVKHTATEWTACILMTYNNTPSVTCYKHLNYFLFNSLTVLEPSSDNYQILKLCVPSHMKLLKTIKQEFQIASHLCLD